MMTFGGWKAMRRFLVILLHILSIGQSKYVSGKSYVAPGRVNEIAKFNFGVGTGHINGSIEYAGIPKGEIYLFMDTRWFDKFHATEACDKVKHAHSHFPIGSVGARISKGLGTGIGNEPVEGSKGRKKWVFSWSITHRVRTYGWYMVIADCSKEALDKANDPEVEEETNDEDAKSKRNRRKKKNKKKNRYIDRIEYEMEFLNSGYSHLSADEWWLTEIYVLTTIILVAGWFFFSNLMQKTYGNAPKHLVITLIRVAYILQIVSMSFEIFHQIVYRYNGTGVWLFDFFSEMVEGFSQTTISFVLLCLANGWTFASAKVKNKYDPSVSEVLNNPNLIDIDNPVLLLLIVFMFLSILLQLVNKLYDDSFMKFHDHETYAGMALLAIRFVFGILFFWSLFKTILSERRKGAGEQFIGFLTNLMVFGSMWFLAFPLIVFFASFFAHYLRHFVVTSGVLLTQSVCLGLLSYEFGSNRSMFAKFSQVQQEGMLPGFNRNSTYSRFA